MSNVTAVVPVIGSKWIRKDRLSALIREVSALESSPAGMIVRYSCGGFDFLNKFFDTHEPAPELSRGDVFCVPASNLRSYSSVTARVTSCSADRVTYVKTIVEVPQTLPIAEFRDLYPEKVQA